MPKNVEKRKRKTKASWNGIYLKKLVGSEIIEKSLKVNQGLNISFFNNFLLKSISQLATVIMRQFSNFHATFSSYIHLNRLHCNATVVGCK